MNEPIKLAVIGAGFWSQYQIPAWLEMDEVALVGVCDLDKEKAEEMADRWNIPHVYTDAFEMMDKLAVDAVDIITNVETHARFVEGAAERGIHAICQKPLAPDLDTARKLVSCCEDAGVKLYVHENFRWQMPIRYFKTLLESEIIGKPFKARVTYCNSFPVFDNQPFLAELDQFILTDIGTHVLDIVRFLFGEVDKLYCQTATVNPHIKGEDVATTFMQMNRGLQCYVEMSYASILENERFPQTFILVEGSEGSLELGPDFMIKTTTRSGTSCELVTLPHYEWADPDYALIHSSIVATHANILEGLLGNGEVETSGVDNLKTLELVFSCYKSAAKQQLISL